MTRVNDQLLDGYLVARDVDAAKRLFAVLVRARRVAVALTQVYYGNGLAGSKG